MLPLILLAAMAGQIDPNYPPREWLWASVEGQTVRLWGWRNYPSGVRFYREENPIEFTTEGKFRRHREPLSPGQVIDRDGAVNNGLILQQRPPTHRLETNDPDLGRKLHLQDERPHCATHVDSPCPGPGPCPRPRPDPIPDPFPDEPKPPAWEAHKDYLIPVAVIAGAVFIGLAIFRRRT